MKSNTTRNWAPWQLGWTSLVCSDYRKESESAAAGSLWVKVQPRRRDWSGPNIGPNYKWEPFGPNFSKCFHTGRHRKLGCQSRAQLLCLQHANILWFLVGTSYTSTWVEYVSSLETAGVHHPLSAPTNVNSSCCFPCTLFHTLSHTQIQFK